MDWSEIFHKDGSWRDIRIRGTTLADWQRFLDYVRDRSELNPSFLWDREEVSLPSHASAIFEKHREATPLLSVDLGGIVLNCHFFTPDEIELDLDPREITKKADADRVFEFIAALGRHLQKKVELTEENMRDRVLHTFAVESG